MKTIVVTDIHGCLEELESVWAQAGFDPETDKLICLGDLMDRGPYSFGVFDRFRSLKRKMGERCIMILGNHDDMMIYNQQNAQHDAYNAPGPGAEPTRQWFMPDGCEIRDRRHSTPLRSITVTWKNSFAGFMKCVHIMRMRMPFLFMPD